MKYMIASDIHGSAYYCKRMLDVFAEEKADRLLLLGDLLYHGPRNDLPREYAPKQVIAMLNDRKDKILAVRGNCDAQVDQMVLEFPILAEYAVLEMQGHLIYCTHGHVFHEQNLLPLSEGDVLLHGHTHIPCAKKVHGISICNPGSVSIPKEGNLPSYGILEAGVFTIKTLEKEIIKEYQI